MGGGTDAAVGSWVFYRMAVKVESGLSEPGADGVETKGSVPR